MIDMFRNQPEKAIRAKTCLDFFLEGQTEEIRDGGPREERDGPETSVKPWVLYGMTGGFQLILKTFPVIRVRRQQEG